MGKQWAAVLVVGALLAGACGTSRSNSSDETPGHPGVVLTTPTTRRAPTTSTTTVPAYSFDDSVPPPKLVNTGTDYIAILKSLEAYGNWAAAHRPDPAQVAVFVAPGTPLSSQYASDLAHLRDNNRRGIEILGRPSTYTVLSVKSDAFSARAAEDVIAQRIVDREGRVGSELKPTALSVYHDLVVRIHGQWYLAASELQGSEHT